MTPHLPRTSLGLRSLVRPDRTVEVFIDEEELREPAPGEVLVRVEATPANPSDIGPLFARADLSQAELSGTVERPVLRAPLSDSAMQAMADRIGRPISVGVEGAGTVVAAGSAPESQALLHRIVGISGGGLYNQYRYAPASSCLVLPTGVTAAQAAGWYVNPMTALGIVATARRGGHTALVHTAAASSLGQMLQRLSLEDAIDVVNVVRHSDQETLLSSIGARHVCNSSSDRFAEDLVDAIAATGAMVAFDAVGGGDLSSRILTAMDVAARRSAGEREGSIAQKQVYVYGYLDRHRLELDRTFGAAWTVTGWHLQTCLRQLGSEAVAAMRARVASGLGSTFATAYAGEVSLAGALQPDVARIYGRMETGTKFLINPSL